METFPVILDHVFFTKMLVEAIPNHQHQPNHVIKHVPENNIHIHEHDDMKDDVYRFFSVTIKTSINKLAEVSDPYRIEFEAVGKFRVNKNQTEEEISKGVTIVGHSVVYGSIREAILWTTSRQPFGPLNLGLSILKPSPQDLS